MYTSNERVIKKSFEIDVRTRLISRVARFERIPSESTESPFVMQFRVARFLSNSAVLRWKPPFYPSFLSSTAGWHWNDSVPPFINSLRKQIPSELVLSFPFASLCPITRANQIETITIHSSSNVCSFPWMRQFPWKGSVSAGRRGKGGEYPREICFLYGGLSDLSPTETTARSSDLFVPRQGSSCLGWILFFLLPFFSSSSFRSIF